MKELQLGIRVTIYTAQKMKFSIKHFFSKCECVTFTEEILDGKLHFLPSDRMMIKTPYLFPRVQIWSVFWSILFCIPHIAYTSCVDVKILAIS